MKITRAKVGDLIDARAEKEPCIYYGVGSRFLYEKENIIKCEEAHSVKLNLLVVGDGESKGRECFWSSTAMSYWNNEIGGAYYENY